MSQSPITVTYSLEDVLKEINGKLDKIEQKFETKFDTIQTKFDTIQAKLDTIQKDVNDLKVGQARLEENLTGINKRLESQEFINRSIAVGLILTLVTGAIKLFFPNFPH